MVCLPYRGTLPGKKIANSLEVERLKIELVQVKADSLAFVKNMANNLCCKAKVDNPGIKFYIVSNNKIVCTVDSGEPIIC